LLRDAGVKRDSVEPAAMDGPGEHLGCKTTVQKIIITLNLVLQPTLNRQILYVKD
jgi:hypothetical protein